MKDPKGQFIGINTKQNVREKRPEMNVNVFTNQIWRILESIDYLFWFIQIKVTMLKDLKHEDIIYQKELLIIITSSMKKKTMINQLILI